AEATERERRVVFAEQPDGLGYPGLWIVRSLARCGSELPLGGDWMVERLEGDTVEDLRVRAVRSSRLLEDGDLASRAERADPRGSVERRHEARQLRPEARVEE